MYLSRVEIDAKNHRKLKKLTHLGAYHNWVEQSFPAEIDKGERFRHLWRIDELGNHKYLLIVSQDKPDLNKLEDYGVPGTAQTKNYDTYLNNLSTDNYYKFRLTANPSYRISDKEKKSHVVPHITIAQQMKWLFDRTEKNGFKLFQGSDNNYDFTVVNRNWPVLYKKGNKKVRLSQVTFEGVLKVIDIDKFKKAMTCGIGREKAYGMGLLTVIPLRK